MEKHWIIVRFEGSGFHRWKDAPDKYEHLRHAHHHTFRVTCRIEVTHSERELEFISVARSLGTWFRHQLDTNEFAELSCEAMAERIAQRAVKWWQHKGAIEIEVTEDGIHGGGFSTR